MTSAIAPVMISATASSPRNFTAIPFADPWRFYKPFANRFQGIKDGEIDRS
jgi:hypothetical protein